MKKICKDMQRAEVEIHTHDTFRISSFQALLALLARLVQVKDRKKVRFSAKKNGRFTEAEIPMTP